MSTDDDDEGHDRLVIDDPMDDVASTQLTLRKATSNFVNSSPPGDMDMEEGELIDPTETILQSSVSSKNRENESRKKQTASTSFVLDGEKTVSASVGITTKDRSAGGSGTKGNNVDNGHHHSDQKSVDSWQPKKPIWDKSHSPSSDSVSNKKSVGSAEASLPTLNSKNPKRSSRQDLEDCSEEVATNKSAKEDKSETLKNSNLNAGVKNFLSPQPPASKKKKMVDKSTCVLTKACQMEDALLSLKPGSTACLNITIVCKAGANTLYILAKWKGKEYHGVLTDGEPIHSHLYAQKRGEKNSDHPIANSAVESGHSDKASVSVLSKVRGKRGANRQTAGATDKKSRHADDAAENTCQSGEPNSSNTKSHEEDNLPSTAKSLFNKQYELASDKTFVRRCPHKQCGYRFESIGEVNTHLVMAHADTKAIMCEAIATQTDLIETTTIGIQACEKQQHQERLSSVCAKCKQSTEEKSKPSSSTAVQKITEEKSLQDLFKVVKKLGGEPGTKSSTSPGAFSDISDDGAPMLEKEENFESNKSGVEKKTEVNEPIKIIPPENTGPTLDILSPVLSSTATTATKQSPGEQSVVQKQDLPTSSGSSSMSVASPLMGKRSTDSCAAQPATNPSSAASNKSSVVQPEALLHPVPSIGPQQQSSSSAVVSLPLAPPGANPPPHIYMNQMPMNPFQAASFLNPAGFYTHPQLAAQFAAAAGQTSASSGGANSRLVSPSLQQHPLAPSPFAVNGGGMSSPLGPSASGASGCLSTGKSDTNSQLQRQHKIYELKQLQQQQQQPPSTSSLAVPCNSSGEGGRTSATSLLAAGLSVGGESPVMLRSSSALPLAAGSPSVLTARAPPFGGHRGVPGVPSPSTSMAAASLPTQMQLQLANALHPQASASQAGMNLVQMHNYQMQMQRLNQNLQAFSRNQNEIPSLTGGTPTGAMDIATYAALFGGGNNSQLFQQQSTTGSSGVAGSNQQNLLQPPK